MAIILVVAVCYNLVPVVERIYGYLWFKGLALLLFSLISVL